MEERNIKNLPELLKVVRRVKETFWEVTVEQQNYSERTWRFGDRLIKTRKGDGANFYKSCVGNILKDFWWGLWEYWSRPSGEQIWLVLKSLEKLWWSEEVSEKLYKRFDIEKNNEKRISISYRWYPRLDARTEEEKEPFYWQQSDYEKKTWIAS